MPFHCVLVGATGGDLELIFRPDPRPDALIELPFMTDILTVKLPDATESPQVGRAFGPASSDHPVRYPYLYSIYA